MVLLLLKFFYFFLLFFADPTLEAFRPVQTAFSPCLPLPFSLAADKSLLNTCRAKTSKLPMRAIKKGRRANRFQNSNFTGWRKRWVWLSWQPIGTEVWSGSVAPPPVQIPLWLWRQYTSTGEHDASLQVNSCALSLIEAPQAEIL